MLGKRIIEIVITVLILLASLSFFPLLGAAYGFAGISRANLVVTGVFVVVWMIVLFVAMIMRSRLLINMYLCYWLVIVAISMFLGILRVMDVLQYIAFTLFILFITPLIGIYYLFSDASGMVEMPVVVDVIILFIIPLCMLLLGLYVKKVFIKGLPHVIRSE